MWALYQRTRKEDTVKEKTQREVTVKRKGKMVTVTRTVTQVVDEDFGWKDPKAADAWLPRKIDGIQTLRHRKVRVVRDYGRFDRREAPQFYPDVKERETKHPEPKRPKPAH